MPEALGGEQPVFRRTCSSPGAFCFSAARPASGRRVSREVSRQGSPPSDQALRDELIPRSTHIGRPYGEGRKRIARRSGTRWSTAGMDPSCRKTTANNLRGRRLKSDPTFKSVCHNYYSKTHYDIRIRIWHNANDAKATNQPTWTTPLGWAESGRHQTRPLRRGGQASRRPPTCPLGVRAVGRRASATHWCSTE